MQSPLKFIPAAPKGKIDRRTLICDGTEFTVRRLPANAMPLPEDGGTFCVYADRAACEILIAENTSDAEIAQWAWKFLGQYQFVDDAPFSDSKQEAFPRLAAVSTAKRRGA